MIFTGVRLVGAILQVVAPSYELIAVARFLVGVGVLGTYIATYVLSNQLISICRSNSLKIYSSSTERQVSE